MLPFSKDTVPCDGLPTAVTDSGRPSGSLLFATRDAVVTTTAASSLVETCPSPATGTSTTLDTPRVKFLSKVAPSASVTRTEIVWNLAVSKSSSELLATVITPVFALIAKRPPASSSSE